MKKYKVTYNWGLGYIINPVFQDKDKIIGKFEDIEDAMRCAIDCAAHTVSEIRSRHRDYHTTIEFVNPDYFEEDDGILYCSIITERLNNYSPLHIAQHCFFIHDYEEF